MLVHAMGNSPHMEQLMRLATKHRLVVIEDTCESLGSRHGGHLLGTQGHFGAYSFYYSHHITSGEGGAGRVQHSRQRDRLPNAAIAASSWLDPRVQ